VTWQRRPFPDVNLLLLRGRLTLKIPCRRSLKITSGFPSEPRRVWAEDADQPLRETLSVVFGEVPAGCSSVRPLVQRGEAGLVLVNTACSPGDLLVVGIGRRGALTRVISGKVCRYCVTHAHCPVLTVPPPDFARELRRGLFTWMFWHRPLTPDQVLQDRAS